MDYRCKTAIGKRERNHRKNITTHFMLLKFYWIHFLDTDFRSRRSFRKFRLFPPSLVNFEYKLKFGCERARAGGKWWRRGRKWEWILKPKLYVEHEHKVSFFFLYNATVVIINKKQKSSQVLSHSSLPFAPYGWHLFSRIQIFIL